MRLSLSTGSHLWNKVPQNEIRSGRSTKFVDYVARPTPVQPADHDEKNWIVPRIDCPLSGVGKIQAEPCFPAHPSKVGSLIVSEAELVGGRLRLRAYSNTDAGKSWMGTRIDPIEDSIIFVNNCVTHSGDEGLSWMSPVKVPGRGYDPLRTIAALLVAKIHSAEPARSQLD